jgi:hypothetical protein
MLVELVEKLHFQACVEFGEGARTTSLYKK